MEIAIYIGFSALIICGFIKVLTTFTDYRDTKNYFEKYMMVGVALVLIGSINVSIGKHLLDKKETIKKIENIADEKFGETGTTILTYLGKGKYEVVSGNKVYTAYNKDGDVLFKYTGEVK